MNDYKDQDLKSGIMSFAVIISLIVGVIIFSVLN
jgi:hypothetical protein